MLVDIADEDLRIKGLDQHAVFRKRTRLDDEAWVKHFSTAPRVQPKAAAGGFVFL